MESTGLTQRRKERIDDWGRGALRLEGRRQKAESRKQGTAEAALRTELSHAKARRRKEWMGGMGEVVVRRWWSRQYWFLSVVGSLVLGLGLPVLLVSWNGGPENRVLYYDRNPEPMTQEALMGLVSLALILCSLFTIIFSTIVYFLLNSGVGADGAEVSATLKLGAMLSVVFAFLNVPGYWAGAFLEPGTIPVFIKLPLLFIVAGVSSGVWIGWQAWRATHEDAPFFPRYSLKWMMIFVLSWGAVLAVYAPR